ncbi:hypothetical protein PybrP1_000093 [[Pythium] brassicae (nom. inval.)]|nr:hypothetical protein PybrP1_000093 [[Pythium] brassicae (nom. inval.)]
MYTQTRAVMIEPRLTLFRSIIPAVVDRCPLSDDSCCYTLTLSSPSSRGVSRSEATSPLLTLFAPRLAPPLSSAIDTSWSLQELERAKDPLVLSHPDAGAELALRRYRIRVLVLELCQQLRQHTVVARVLAVVVHAVDRVACERSERVREPHDQLRVDPSLRGDGSAFEVLKQHAPAKAVRFVHLERQARELPGLEKHELAQHVLHAAPGVAQQLATQPHERSRLHAQHSVHFVAAREVRARRRHAGLHERHCVVDHRPCRHERPVRSDARVHEGLDELGETHLVAQQQPRVAVHKLVPLPALEEVSVRDLHLHERRHDHVVRRQCAQRRHDERVQVVDRRLTVLVRCLLDEVDVHRDCQVVSPARRGGWFRRWSRLAVAAPTMLLVHQLLSKVPVANRFLQCRNEFAIDRMERVLGRHLHASARPRAIRLDDHVFALHDVDARQLATPELWQSLCVRLDAMHNVAEQGVAEPHWRCGVRWPHS